MAIFDIHHPWAFTFGILGNIISIFVYLAPLTTFVRIYKEKSTMGFDSLPYVVALFSSMLWMYYALLKTNTILLISINLFGCIIETVYIFMYLFYASKKARTRTAKLLGLMNVGSLSLIFLLTFFVFDGQVRAQVVGWICVAVSVSVFAAPLSIVFQVVRTRSVEFMPFPLSFFLTLSAIMWFAYGLFQKGFMYKRFQMCWDFSWGCYKCCFTGYTVTRSLQKLRRKKLPEQLINIVVVGTPQVDVDCHNSGDKIHQDEDEVDGPRNVVPCALTVEPNEA